MGKGIPGLSFQTHAHENFMMVFGLCALVGWMDGWRDAMISHLWGKTLPRRDTAIQSSLQRYS